MYIKDHFQAPNCATLNDKMRSFEEVCCLFIKTRKDSGGKVNCLLIKHSAETQLGGASQLKELNQKNKII